jgi:DNA replication protein DnaC
MYASETREKRIVKLICPKHGEYTGEAVKIKIPGIKEGETNPECPVCQKESEAEELRRNEERARRETIQKWRSMNIDEKYHDATFDNFNAYNDELREYLDICRAFAENPDGKLVMIGKNGNGKTYLAVSILKKMGGVIYTAADIAINIRSTYNGGESSEKDVFDELTTVPLLVIDEVEKIKESEWKNYWMSHVIGKRYNRMLPLIIIANCHMQKDCTEKVKPCCDCLEYHLENDVISRIIEDGIIMKFNSGDYRRKIREARFGNKSNIG